MQHPDSSILANSTDSRQSQAVKKISLLATPKHWINRLTRRWSIHQKIGYGYFLAVGIAVMGTTAGLIIGEYYENSAREALEVTHERFDIIRDLDKSFAEVKWHQQQSLNTPQNYELQQQEITELHNSIIEASQQLAELKSSLTDYPAMLGYYTTYSKNLLSSCEQDLRVYNQLVKSWLEQVNSEHLVLHSLEPNQPIWVKKNGQALLPKFEQLSTNLEQLIQLTEIQQKQANYTFKKAKILRASIIATSMILSMGIAAILAFYTSRAIARPIEAVTYVAQQATQEDNYTLQAPITTEDEIAVLATSLNHLIQRVATQIRELKQAQTQLIQSEKMSSLGNMVAGIAHEINNPINFIHGNLTYAEQYTHDLLELLVLYQRHYPDPVPEIQQKIHDIELDFLQEDFLKIMASMQVGTERIRQIILSLRNFSRLDESERKRVNLHEGIDNTLLIMSPRLNKKIDLIKQYDNLPLIECYPAQLNQVFMNLISNAIDAMSGENNLRSKYPSSKQITIQTKQIDENTITVVIRDNGSGISPEIKTKIFDPFFTTKPVGQGTGMGLAICYQIVEKHQGKIEVISELHQGAEFVVTLPIEQRLVTQSGNE